jgi:hypothetical protein
LKPNAAVIQVAFQGFGENFIPDANSLCVNVESIAYDKQLFDFDENVISWWKNQPAIAKESLLEDRKIPCVIIEDVISFLRRIASEYKDVRLWSNHLLFDVRILNNMMDVYSNDQLEDFIKYYNFMDYSTYRNMFVDQVGKEWIEEMKQEYHQKYGRIEHNALSDCRFQIFIMKKIQEALYE